MSEYDGIELEFIDEQTNERYLFTFAIPGYGNYFHVRRYFGNGNSHGEGVPIINGKPHWAPYHLKEKKPFISPTARQFAEKVLEMKAFL